LGSIAPPGEWSHFGSIDAGVKLVNELPQQILALPDQEIHCRVLEVLYDDYYQKLRSYDGPVRYWVDSQTHLVRRAQFTELTPHGPLSWTVTLETIHTGGPAPSWLTSTSRHWETPSLIGKSAPNFELRTADGMLLRLSELRGKVVVLDFWATWCGACVEEVPIMVKLQAEKAMSGVALFGVTDENEADVRAWLSHYKQSFRTLVDGRKVFDDFGIKPIPILVIIDRQGMVADYNLGFHSEHLIRELITKHLSE
jgi:thiol-disulfide isomerase/thioredoxin